MLGFDKLASNARRFRMLMGMSLQEFDLLFVKVEKMYPEEERKRLSKRFRQREIGAGRRFVLSVRERILLLPFYYRTYATQDVAAEVFGVGQATVSRSIEQIAPVVKKCVPIPAKLYARSKRVSTVEELEELFPGTRSPRGRIRAADTEAEAEGYGKVPLFGQGRKAYSQDAVYRERLRPDHPQHQALPRMRTRLQGVQDEAPHVPHESAEPGRFGQGRESARTCGVMATVGIRERRR